MTQLGRSCQEWTAAPFYYFRGQKLFAGEGIMIRKIVLLFVAAIALLCLACSKDSKPTSPVFGVIDGKVTADGVGVPGASVLVSPYTYTEGGKTADSENTFNSVSDGDYHVEILPGQYRISYQANYNGEALSTNRYPITVAAGQTVTINIDLKNPSPANLIVKETNARVGLAFENGYHAISYKIYRSPGSQDNFELIGSSSYNAYTDSPPAIGSYKYRVTAVSPSGETAPCDEALIDFTGTCSPPSALSVSDLISHVYLEWSGYTTNAVEFRIYRSLSNSNWSLLASVSTAEYSDTPGSYGLYSYRVSSVSTYGVESVPTASVTVNFDGRLDAPQRLTLIDFGSNIYLSWGENEQAGSYNLYRSLRSDGGFIKFDSTNEASYTDRPTTSGTYFYWVTAVGSNGLESDMSTSVNCIYDGCLDPPAFVNALDQGLSVLVQWGNVSWAGAFLVFRSDDNGSTYNQIGRAPSHDLEFADRPPEAGDYLYKISTETVDGVEGLLSGPAAVHYTANLQPPLSVAAQNIGFIVEVSWSAVTGATGYTVFRAPTPEGDYVEVADSIGGTIYNNAPSGPGSYYYRVQSFDNSGHRSAMSYYAYVYFTARPLTPTNITLYDYEYYVDISWSFTGSVDSFLVFRATSANGTYVPQFWTLALEDIDWPPTAGHYFYKVQAFCYGVSSEISDYAHVYFTGIMPPPSRLRGYDAGNVVLLVWDAVEGASSYDVYRGTSPDSMVLIQTVYDVGASDAPNHGGVYYYSLVAKTEGGLESPMCSPVMVNFTP
jgi:fibronectin type 3 domain-containing protein